MPIDTIYKDTRSIYAAGRKQPFNRGYPARASAAFTTSKKAFPGAPFPVQSCHHHPKAPVVKRPLRVCQLPTISTEWIRPVKIN
jgi:hypothetical protein